MLIEDLGDVVGLLWVEAELADGNAEAERIWNAAQTVDKVRLDYVRGAVDEHTARLWLIAGRRHHIDVMRERSRRDHPAGKQRDADDR